MDQVINNLFSFDHYLERTEKEKNIGKITLFSNVRTVFESMVVIPGWQSKVVNPISRIMVREMTAIIIFFS